MGAKWRERERRKKSFSNSIHWLIVKTHETTNSIPNERTNKTANEIELLSEVKQIIENWKQIHFEVVFVRLFSVGHWPDLAVKLNLLKWMLANQTNSHSLAIGSLLVMHSHAGFFSFWVNVFTTIPLHFKWKPKGLLLSLLVLLSPFFYVRPFAVILCSTMPLIVRGPLDANGLCRCARRTNDEDNERNRFTLSSLPHHIYSICIPVSQPRYCLNVLYSEPNVIRSCKKNSTLDMHCTH